MTVDCRVLIVAGLLHGLGVGWGFAANRGDFAV